MSGRFPGARNVEELHQNLLQGVESIRPLSDAELRQRGVSEAVLRNPNYVKAAATLLDVEEFDAPFFKYATRDAEILDPQHRLFLECAWEALEAAGYASDADAARRGPSIGVFASAGPVTASYLLANVYRQDPTLPPETRVAVNNDKDYLGTRVSYKLNLRGPGLTVQTACSSSLVAIHLACQSLLNGECDLALAGGASIRFPHGVGYFYQEGEMYSPDGHCRAFDEKGQGTIFGSGVGLVLLKPLVAAIADGDPIEAVIRGSALSNDGGDKISFWATSAAGQLDAMTAALAVAEVPPESVGYIETHGTATELGDPVEIFALNQAYESAERRTCAIGSVKSNIGHAESAAGVIGLIKAVLSLKHRVLYPSLHYVKPNPRIDFERGPFYVNASLKEWPAQEFPRRAAVNSLGIGGTNAHIILEEAPVAEASPSSRPQPEPTHHLLTLSAKSDAALLDLTRLYREHLSRHSEQALADVCFTASTRRIHFEHRLALVAATAQEACAGLAQEPAEAPWIAGQASTDRRPRIAFLFTGQGAQYVNMGRELFLTQPVFQAALTRCAEILRPHLEEPLLTVIYPPAGATADAQRLLSQTIYTQPALFALEYALACLWRSWGVIPDAVMGHSVGELVAACVAGVFSLEEGLALIAARGRLMQALPANGSMFAVWAAEAVVRDVLAPFADRVSVAAVNGPEHLTLSGEHAALRSVIEHLTALQIRTKELAVSHAFHSPLMEPMLAEFAQIARSLRYAPPALALISNLTGELATAAIGTPEYWVSHVRQPVRFAAGLQTLRAAGHDVFIELGPSPVLLGMAEPCFDATAACAAPVLLPSLRAGAADWQVLLRSLGALYVRGARIEWKQIDPNGARCRVALPTYPFQRKRYHFAPPLVAPAGASARADCAHRLLGHKLASPLRTSQFESRLSARDPAYLAAHRFGDRCIFPASAYYEMALAAGARVLASEAVALADVHIHTPLYLSAEEPCTLQCIVEPTSTQVQGRNQFAVQIYSAVPVSEATAEQLAAAPDETHWTLHAVGRLEHAAPVSSLRDDGPTQLPSGWTIVEKRPAASEPELHGAAAEPEPRIEPLWRNGDTLRGQLQLPDALLAESGYLIHPQILTACLELLPLLLEDDPSRSYIQIGLERLQRFGRATQRLWFTLRLHPAREPVQTTSAVTLRADLFLFDSAGQPFAALTGIALQPIRRAAQPGEAKWQSWLYAPSWRLAPRTDFLRAALPSPEQLLRRSAEDALPPVGALTAAERASAAYLELRSVAHIHAALVQLGWQPRSGRRFTTGELAAELRVQASHLPLFQRLLAILADSALLHRAGDGWETTQLTGPDPASLARTAQHPDIATELTLVDRCGASLAQVLTGQMDPLELLFPGGDLTMALRVYRDSAIIRRLHARAEQVVAALRRQLLPGQGLRILEVGGGTGGMTTYLLPHLPPERTRYVFTDIGSAFLNRAREQFAAYPFLEFRTLDIEKDPAAQGFASQTYDVVIAANVLHATQDLRTTLRHVADLLVPQGILLMAEATSQVAWLDMVFGLTEGWWRFTDHDLRPAHPLLSAAQWRSILSAQGFRHAVALAADSEVDDATQASAAVIVAQAPAPAMASTTSVPVVDHRPPTPASVRHFLLLTRSGGIGETLSAQLRSRGERCTLVYRGDSYVRMAEDRVFLSDQPADWQRLLHELGPFDGVIHEWQAAFASGDAMPAHKLDEAIAQGCRSALHLTQALVELPVPPALWIITHGGHTVPAQKEPVQLAAAALWGLGRCIALEHPELRCTLIDVDVDPGPQHQPRAAEEAECLIPDILQPEAESQLLFRRGQRHVARLERVLPAESSQLSVRADATYLITGGLGGLGLATARWLVAQGARHVVLLGRRAPDAAAQARIAAMEETGAHVLTAQADIADMAQLARVFTDIESCMPPLRGVIHAAGIFFDRLLRSHDWDSFHRVFAAKVTGAWNLHHLTRERPLDFFVLYSAGAALFGERGLSNYVAANATLDALSHLRRQQGLPALSVNWGPWRQTGMAAAVGAQRVQKWASGGFSEMEPEDALAALAALLRSRNAQAGVVPIHWPVFLSQTMDPGQRSFYAQLAAPATRQTPTSTPTELGFREQLDRTAAPLQHERLTQHVKEQLARVLGMAIADVPDWQRGFTDLGLDSLLAMEFRNRLQASLSCHLPATLTFKYPRLEPLAAYLAEEVLRLETAAPPAAGPDSALRQNREPATEAASLSAAELELSVSAELAELEALLRQKFT